ncbi:MAG TPA: 5'-nucleotidase [Blastocatellia bacterium]|nr:5'-nucleotidase [Blastocatellia bacterium]
MESWKNQLRLRAVEICAILAFFWPTLPVGQTPRTADVRIEPLQTAIDQSIAEDKTVKELVSRYGERLRKEMRTVIGRAAEDLDKGLGGGSLGAFVADVIRWRAEQLAGRPVHLALQNSGGLRRSIPKGPITVGTIFEVMPFENQIVLCDLPGDLVSKVIERLVERATEQMTDALSGATIIACEGKVRSALISGAPIDPRKVYTLATSDFLQQGGASYDMLKECRRVTETGILIRQALIDFIRAETAAHREIRGPATDRFRINCGS